MDFSDVISPLFIFYFIVIAFSLWRFLASRAARQERTRQHFEPLRAEALKLGSKARGEAEAEEMAELDALLRGARVKEGSP